MTKDVEVPVTVDNEKQELLPHYASEGAAGADLKASLSESITIPAHGSVLIPTGLRVAIPEGYELQIRPRSGLALKHQITVLNTPGTIDSDYRGEIQVILINHGKQDFIVTPGMRIAQAILAPFTRARYILTDTLAETSRGANGFGHTGSH
jgi:dUTP pyrophosphatase